MSLTPWRMSSITTKEGTTMFQNPLYALRADPDALVFWLTTTSCALSALFALVAPGGPVGL